MLKIMHISMYFFILCCVFSMLRCPSLEFGKRPGLERFTVGTRGNLSRSLAMKRRKCQGATCLGPRRDCNVFTCWWEGTSQPNWLSSTRNPGSRRPPGLINGDHFSVFPEMSLNPMLINLNVDLNVNHLPDSAKGKQSFSDHSLSTLN